MLSPVNLARLNGFFGASNIPLVLIDLEGGLNLVFDVYSYFRAIPRAKYGGDIGLTCLIGLPSHR